MHKIATCCYCGTRAALVLRGEGRHELSCAACGAPLHEMKAIPQPRGDSAVRKPSGGQGARRRTAPKPMPTKPKAQARRAAPEYDESRRAPRRRKPGRRLLSKALEEIWDVVEDIFD
ncbi:hypothetical protein [Roseovarius sp. M141]|uniref:hypothetical protein n=1 Tax=Roseovarius sp. M141 TaxID=2583806 RepID=UPI0020CC0AAE|nr:hypothetical protein [Roseovarius sp. M141]MCQ0092551.1 hypothetical protein [Roseovarius sp. M141]